MTRRFVLAGLLFGFAAMPASASLVFQTSGNAQVVSQSVKAEATFGEVGTSGLWDGSLVLKNDAAVPSKAQLLTGILFSINGSNPALTLTSAGLGTGSVLVLDSSGRTSSSAVNLIASEGNKGGYQFKKDPGSTLGSGGWAREYGVSTIGGTIFNGDIVGNDNYGIIGQGTNVALNTFKSQFPYVLDSVRFQFGNLGSGGIQLTSLTGITFLYGSLPDGFISGSPVSAPLSPPVVGAQSVPEPSTIATAGLGILAIVGWKRRRGASI